MSTTAPIDNILSRLEKVRQRQPGQYSARCPAHADRGPSLSVRETPEGAVLLYCFAGCSVGAVVAALGLDMSELFPPRQLSGKEPKRPARLLTPGQALQLLDREAHLLAVSAANVAHGVVLPQAERDRLNQAAARIGWLLSESGGRHAY